MMTVSSILCIRSKDKENLEKKKGIMAVFEEKKICEALSESVTVFSDRQ